MPLALAPIWSWVMLAAAALVATTGAALTARALLADRPRGRARCPRCWYDMTGSPPPGLTCPECGHQARTPRNLLKTRRRWRLAALGALLALAGAALAAGQRIGDKGWLGAAPTWGYIAALPWMETDGNAMKELGTRVNSGTMRQWEYRWLVRRCTPMLRECKDPARTVELLRILNRVVAGARIKRFFTPHASWAPAGILNHEPTIGTLFDLLGDSDPDVRVGAADCIGISPFSATHPLPKPRVITDLLGQLSLDDPALQNANLRVLSSIGLRGEAMFDSSPAIGLMGQREFLESLRLLPGGESPLPVLLGGLHDKSPVVRAACVWALGMVSLDDTSVQNAVLELADDPDEAVRIAVIRVAGCLPLDGRTARILEEGIKSPNQKRCRAALNAVAGYGAEGAVFHAALKEQLERPNLSGPWNRAINAWIKTGGAQQEASAAMLRVLRLSRSSPPFSPAGVLPYLHELDVACPAALPDLEPLMDSDDWSIRGEAAGAYACWGGDTERATRVLMSGGPGEFSRQQILEGLAVRGRLSVPVMAAWLESENPACRLDAARSLGCAGADSISVLPRLRALRNDADPAVASAADEAVKRIGWATKHPDEATKFREEWPR